MTCSWHAQNMHLHMYGNVSCNGSQLTTYKKANAKVFKLLPSFFTYANILL
jgi:hypothetical protein